MKPLQDFLGVIIFGLATVVLLIGCGNPPLIQPKSDVPVAQTTAATSQPFSTATVEGETTASPESVTESVAPESPLATPTYVPATDAPPAVLETPASGLSETKYAAEKISLAPVNLSLNLPGISAQDAEPPPINFGGWSNSGQQFAFAMLFPDGSAEQWLANIDGTGLKKIDETGLCGLRRWSPDDSQLLCYKYQENGFPTDEIWIIEVDTNEWLKIDAPPGVKIGDTDEYAHNIVWLNEQHLLYATYSKIDPKARRLWLHNIQTKQIKEVQVDDRVKSSWLDIWLAPNKTSVLIWTVDDAWILGRVVEENQQYKLNVIKTVITEAGLLPFWSPDSTKLAMTSYNQLAATLRIIDLNSDQITEIPFPAAVARVEWSPDSQAMIVRIFGAGTETPSPIYTVNANGSSLRQLGEFFLGTMQWSPDGQYLGLFLSDDTNRHNPFGIIKVEVTQ